MENKNLKLVRIAHLVLMIGALVACMYSLVLDMVSSFDFEKEILIYIVGLTKLLPVISIVFGLIYFVEGYKKNAASFYKIYMFLFAVEFVAQIVGYIITKSFEPMRLIFTAISLISICLLFAAKNLGKNKSLIIVGIFIISRIVMLLAFPHAVWADGKLAEIIRGITDIILAVSAGLMVEGKYMDKQARGRE